MTFQRPEIMYTAQTLYSQTSKKVLCVIVCFAVVGTMSSHLQWQVLTPLALRSLNQRYALYCYGSKTLFCQPVLCAKGVCFLFLNTKRCLSTNCPPCTVVSDARCCLDVKVTFISHEISSHWLEQYCQMLTHPLSQGENEQTT